jgi:hypothetical protein
MQNENTRLASVVRSYGLGSSILSAACAGAMIAAPRRLSRYLSLPRSDRLIRLLAARDLLIGATLLNGTMRRRGLAMRSIADATDAALILTRDRDSKLTSRSTLMKVALAVTGAVCALALALTPRSPDA